MSNIDADLAFLAAHQHIKEIAKLHGMTDSNSAEMLDMIMGLDELRTHELAGELWSEEALRALEKLRRIFLGAVLRRDRRISEIEGRTSESENRTLLKDIYYLVGLAQKGNQDITDRVARCLNRFANCDNEIIRRAALDALNEIQKI